MNGQSICAQQGLTLHQCILFIVSKVGYQIIWTASVV